MGGPIESNHPAARLAAPGSRSGGIERSRPGRLRRDSGSDRDEGRNPGSREDRHRHGASRRDGGDDSSGRLQHGRPDIAGGGRGVPGSISESPRASWNFRQRRRIQEVLQARDGHFRRLALHQGVRAGPLRREQRGVHRTAGRHRRHRGRGQSSKQRDRGLRNARRAQQDVGPPGPRGAFRTGRR